MDLAFETVSFSDVALRVIGAFYVFAGYVAARVTLTSYFLDRAIAAKKPNAAETAQSVWLLIGAGLVLAGGVALIAGLALAAWVFVASALWQSAYLSFIAPRYFDEINPPDAKGRRQTANAFVVYSAATALVLWAAYTGKLAGVAETGWPVIVAVAAAAAGYVAYVMWMMLKAPGPSATPLLGAFADGPYDDLPLHPSESKRVKVMAEYDAHPLWALDEGLYGDFAPDALGLSPQLTADLNAWADAYTSSLNRDDPANSLWSAAQHQAHTAAGRSLAVRLAQERADLIICVPDGAADVVEVPADEAI